MRAVETFARLSAFEQAAFSELVQLLDEPGGTLRPQPGLLVFALQLNPLGTRGGLLGEGPWIRVDPGTLQTAHEDVWAIGDVTGIKLANGLPLPKAGIMAELEGPRVAAAIAAEVRGEEPPAGFEGRGFCFMETGKTTAALIQGEFFAQPEPRVELAASSPENARRKHEFEAERLTRWFGG